MADVFLSYSRQSAAAVQNIASALREQGYSVWFDDELPAHQAYADVIATELDKARAVFVIWSAAAAESQWVRSEANRAREHRKLVQARVDGVRLPMPFDQIQCPHISGRLEGPAWKSVITAIQSLVNGEAAPTESVGPITGPLTEPSVAVFPLLERPAGGDGFGDGLADEIVTALARLPGLRVAAASAGTDAAALNVGSYLEGSVRKCGDRARISVRLVDVASRFARWSEIFDRTLSDIFEVQEEIARAVAAALGVTLLDRDGQSISSGASKDPKANSLALKARHLARQEMEVERRTAADLFRQAIERDPEFAIAHAGLADVLVQIARWHLPGWQTDAAEALDAARKAVALTPELADAHLALGAALSLSHDPEAAQAYSQALALSPHDPNVHYRTARYLVLTGDKAGAIRHYERAYELAPDDYRYIVFALQEYQALGDAEGERSCLRRSAAAIDRHLELNPSDVRALGHGAGVMALLGRADESQQMINRAQSLRPHDYGNLATLACAAMLGNDAEQALDLLEKAVATGHGDREWLLQDNDLKPLHGNPRFEALVERMAG